MKNILRIFIINFKKINKNFYKKKYNFFKFIKKFIFNFD